jgi:ABC-type Fe3+-citrate transport system substrate-binding protein
MHAYNNTKKLEKQIKEAHEKELKKHKKMISKFRRKQKQTEKLQKSMHFSTLGNAEKNNSFLNRSNLSEIGKENPIQREHNLSQTPNRGFGSKRIKYLEKDKLIAYVGRGNNDKLICRILQKRQWWKIVEQISNFI